MLLKKSGALVLVAILFIATCLPVYYFLIQQKQIRSEIKQSIKKGVPEKDLFHFNLSLIQSDPSFSWEHKKEFHYKGSMYDIVRIENGIAECINDVQEQKLFSMLDELSKNGLNAKFGGKFKPLQLFNHNTDVQLTVSSIIFQNVFPFVNSEILSSVNEWIIPPERCG